MVNDSGAYIAGGLSEVFGPSRFAGGARLLVAVVLLFLMVQAVRAGLALWQARRGDRLARACYSDALTRLHNRGALKMLGARMVERSRCGDVPLHFLLIVVDGLRELEMKCGPRVRDGAICAVAEVLKTLNSSQTSLARLRSGEFGVFLLGQQAQEAAAFAERLQAEVKDLRLEFAGQKVSVSLCVAQMRPEDKGWAEMLCRADVGLMCARSLGPNQMVRDAAGGVKVATGRRSFLGRTHSTGVQTVTQ